MIRQRFPNAKVAVNGSRDLGGEPWNQVIIDRFGQGAFAADAAMMHFYPKSTNPDSLNMELCQAVESAVDIEDILHYQQVFTEYLFEQRNTDLFLESDMELWFTEFNNYDYSEKCMEYFGVQYADDDHNYDSGNWLHALSIFNLFNSFSHYASEKSGIWNDADHGLDITKMCMHLMYGGDRETAIRSDLKTSPAGIAARSLMNTLQLSDSMANILIAGPSDLAINGTSWSPVDAAAGIPRMHEFEYTDRFGERITTQTYETYGWLFKGESDRVIIVNLSGPSLDLDLSALPGYDGVTYFKTSKVPKTKLTWTLADEEYSPGLYISEGLTDQSILRIPPFSFTEIILDHSYRPPSNNGCANALEIEPSLWGEDDWTEVLYNGAGGNRPSCIDESPVDDLWFRFTPEAPDEIIMAYDPEHRLDLVIELYPECSAEPIACFDSYGADEIEKAFFNDLWTEQEYRFRVFAKVKDPLDIDHFQVQIKTTRSSGILQEQCGQQAFHGDSHLLAESPASIYSSDSGIDAFRFSFIPSSGEAEIFKNESDPPAILALEDVQGLESWTEYEVKVQHRIRTEANGTVVTLWSEKDEGCTIGFENNCHAFLSAPTGLTKSLEPVNDVIDRIQLKWFKENPQIPYSIADSAACDIEYWPVKDLATNLSIESPPHTYLSLKRKAGKEFFKWPLKFNKPSIWPNHSYKWKIRCACEYGEDIMSPWSVEKFFNTPDFDPLTNTYDPLGGLVSSDDATDMKGMEAVSMELGSFEIDLSLSPEDRLMLFSLDGKVIPTQTVRSSKDRIRLSLSTDVRAGVYLLQVQGEGTDEVIPIHIQ
ncbi:MAG: hypothetical protein HKN79_07475 [Flavobacteriales bacterium]|nr:hypothetical protein [Flavobacteriales bacterium]